MKKKICGTMVQLATLLVLMISAYDILLHFIFDNIVGDIIARTMNMNIDNIIT